MKHWIITSTFAVNLYKTWIGNNVTAYDNSDITRYLVWAILSRL